MNNLIKGFNVASLGRNLPDRFISAIPGKLPFQCRLVSIGAMAPEIQGMELDSAEVSEASWHPPERGCVMVRNERRQSRFLVGELTRGNSMPHKDHIFISNLWRAK